VAIGTGGATVEVTAANVLIISGTIDGVGNTLTKTGTGTLTLSGTPNYGTLHTTDGITNVDSSFIGGTSTVNADATTNFGVSQTLAALNIGNGAVVTFGAGPEAEPGAGATSAFGAATVPEPGSLGLLVVGALGLLGRRSRMARW